VGPEHQARAPDPDHSVADGLVDYLGPEWLRAVDSDGLVMREPPGGAGASEAVLGDHWGSERALCAPPYYLAPLGCQWVLVRAGTRARLPPSGLGVPGRR